LIANMPGSIRTLQPKVPPSPCACPRQPELQFSAKPTTHHSSAKRVRNATDAEYVRLTCPHGKAGQAFHNLLFVHTYDERDKAYLFTDEQGHTSKIDFDGDGNTTTLTDELGHVSTYTYDAFDKLAKKAFPDGTYQSWVYDPAGNITSLRTAAGNTILQTYDTRNRMLTQNYGSTITNSYDILGRLLTASEGGTSLTYVYDRLGRNTSFTDQAGQTSTYTYDLDGNRMVSCYCGRSYFNSWLYYHCEDSR